MDAAAGRRRGRAEVDAAERRPVRVEARAGPGEQLPRSIAPPLMSPPTRLRLRASKSAGVDRARARGRGRGSPGAKRSTCASIALGHVAASSRSARGSTPTRCACPSGARVGSNRRVLREEHERAAPARRPRHGARSERGDLVERPAEMHGRGAARTRVRARDRPVERPVELERAGAVAVAGEPAVVARGEPVAAIRRSSRGDDVGEHDARRAAARRPGSTVCTSPPSPRGARATSASAIACAPPRGKPQPATWPSTASASPKPALGRRSSGSIECAASPAKSARARSVSKRRAATERASPSAARERSREPRERAHERAARGGNGPSTSGSTARQRADERLDEPAVARRVGAERPPVARASRSSTTAVPSSSGCATARGRVDPVEPELGEPRRTARRGPSGGSPSRRRAGSRAASAPRCAHRRRAVAPPRAPHRAARRGRASAPPRGRSAPSRRRPRGGRSAERLDQEKDVQAR